LNKYQTPCSVFVTFISEEGVSRAKEYSTAVDINKSNCQPKMCGYDTFLGEKIDV